MPSPTQPARLPDHHLQRPVSELAVGDVAYVNPWVMFVDTNLGCWLDRTAHTGPDSENDVMRVEHRADGFHVWPPPGYRWRRGGAGRDPAMIPIREIHGDPTVLRAPVR